MISTGTDTWISATAFCADNNGHLYAVTISGEILVGAVKRSDASTSGLPPVTRIIQPYPALDFVVTHAAASPSGQLLILAGFHEGGEEAALAVVNTRNVGRQTGGDKCKVTFVDQQTYWDKPGLKFHQVQWHSYSQNHFVVLTSDSRFRIYNIHNLSYTEQVFHLKLNSGSSGYGIRGTSAMQQVTSFCFGPPAGWGFFTVFFITSTGSIYSLCPVAPFGMVCPSPSCEQLDGSSMAAATAQLWLQTALSQEGLTPSLPGHPVKVRPQVSDMTAALQGPINAAALEEEPAAQLSGTCRIASGHYADVDASEGFADESPREGKRVRPLDPDNVPQPVYCTALLAVDARGRACGYLMTRECSPSWVDVRGEPQEDSRGVVVSVSHSCERQAAESSLELLDLLDLGLDRTRGEGLASSRQLRVVDDDSEDEAEEEDVYLQLLSSSQELPGQFWLGHHSGVWLISLPWLRVVAEWYAEVEQISSLRPPSLPEITEHCISTSSSRSIIGIALMDLTNPLLPGGESTLPSCMCASLDVERGVTLHWPMIALADAAGERLQTWGLPKATDLDTTVEAQHKRLLAGLDKITLPKPPASQSKEQVLKYLVDSTACLTRHYSPYCQTAHDDLQLRVQQLHQETYAQASKTAALADQLKQRQQTQQSIEERVRDLKERLQSMSRRVDAIMERHSSAPRPLGPQEKQVLNDVLPAMKEHVKQLETGWQRVQARVTSALQQQQENQKSASSTPSHTPYGRRGQYTAPSGLPPPSPGAQAGSIPDSQAAKLFQKMEINTGRLKDAQRRLAMMESRLQAHIKNKAAEQIALQLQPLAERDDED